MESSRKTYEMATQRLVTFLEEVTTALQYTSPAHRKLIESTKAEVSRVARRASRAVATGHTIHRTRGPVGKRLSLDSSTQGGVMFRAESMPGM